METVKLNIGTIQSLSSGGVQDLTRVVEFEAEKLAKYSEFGDQDGRPTDTRGTRETLYRTADGRLIVHVEDWSHWAGEPTTYSLHEATEADLGPNGKFESLGLEAGMGRPLTLEEALEK